MKKFGLAPSLMAIVCVIAVSVGALSAHARQQYSNAFKEKYCDPKSNDPAVKKLIQAVETAKCNTCHVGKTKKERNKYGEEIGKLLSKNEKDKDKITKALDDVAKMKVDDKDSKSKTYGDLLKEGLLPGGDEKKDDKK
jgi:hypothetical protein